MLVIGQAARLPTCASSGHNVHPEAAARASSLLAGDIIPVCATGSIENFVIGESSSAQKVNIPIIKTDFRVCILTISDRVLFCRTV